MHKDNAFVCILGENGEKIEFKTGVLTVELDSFRDRLVELGVGEVAMESTAVYWMPIWRILESDFRLYLVNPLSIKQLPGRKSDVKDAEWIAMCLQKGFIRGSFVPPLAVQQLRQYNRRLFDLNKQAVYVQNKMDAALQRCNIRISNYVSNIDTKGYREVVELLSEGTTDPELLTGEGLLLQQLQLQDGQRQEERTPQGAGRHCKETARRHLEPTGQGSMLLRQIGAGRRSQGRIIGCPTRVDYDIPPTVR